MYCLLCYAHFGTTTTRCRGLFLCTLYIAKGCRNSEIIGKWLKKEKQLNWLEVLLFDKAFQRLLALKDCYSWCKWQFLSKVLFTPAVASSYGHWMKSGTKDCIVQYPVMGLKIFWGCFNLSILGLLRWLNVGKARLFRIRLKILVFWRINNVSKWESAWGTKILVFWGINDISK